ncbi:hypothetical protein PbB2_02832 [Candidatus Phycosocius bacilliformis]|uniref:GcrA cell cycle regulator n=1 Tax=Candidatus Phycosocius bacilliformis TaxID=1445552 RepID=A0A2P2EDK4_9PROT|nr:GcrA family cell cycle regulator [Candidatus Phycosocius bacilliformis]GBF59140.1 hypothetical protein PbB2_02832 [Candidatus Phycosocius bacilliformis]
MTTKQVGLIEKVLRMWSEGKSGTEIALATNISRSAVQGHLHRARQNHDARAKLRGQMNSHMYLAMKRASLAQDAYGEILAKRPKPEPKPKPTEKELPRPKDPPPPPPQARLLEHLSRNSCRYCYSDEAPYLLCGEPTSASSSWCEEHRRIVFKFVRTKPLTPRELAL